MMLDLDKRVEDVKRKSALETDNKFQPVSPVFISLGSKDGYQSPTATISRVSPVPNDPEKTDKATSPQPIELTKQTSEIEGTNKFLSMGFNKQRRHTNPNL